MATQLPGFLKNFQDILTGGRWSNDHWIPGGNLGDAGTALADILNQAGGMESSAASAWGNSALEAAKGLGAAYMQASLAQIGYLGQGIGVIGETTAAANNIVKLATERAIAMQDVGTQKAISTLGQYHSLAQSQLLPYSSAGQWALGQYQGLLSGQKDFRTDPGYQFRLGEGQKAIEQSAAAKGLGQSGKTLKSITSYAQGLASDEFQKVADRYANLATMGQSSAEKSSSLAASTGAGMAGTYMSGAERTGAYSMQGGAKQADIIQRGGLAQAGMLGEQGQAAWNGILGSGQSLYTGQMNQGYGNWLSQAFLANAMRDSGSALFDIINKGWDTETAFAAANQGGGGWWDQWGGKLLGGLGAAVGTYFGGPLGGALGGTAGNALASGF